jgi:hypothetical protein
MRFEVERKSSLTLVSVSIEMEFRDKEGEVDVWRQRDYIIVLHTASEEIPRSLAIDVAGDDHTSRGVVTDV